MPLVKQIMRLYSMPIRFCLFVFRVVVLGACSLVHAACITIKYQYLAFRAQLPCLLAEVYEVGTVSFLSFSS